MISARGAQMVQNLGRTVHYSKLNL